MILGLRRSLSFCPLQQPLNSLQPFYASLSLRQWDDHILYWRNYVPNGRRWLLVVVRSRSVDVCAAYHSDPKTLMLDLKHAATPMVLLAWYLRRGMYSFVRTYIRACTDCQCRKTPALQPASPLRPLHCPLRPYDCVSINLYGLLSSSLSVNR